MLSAAKTIFNHQSSGVSYSGQKSHEKQVLAYIDRARPLDFAEEELEALCAYMSTMTGTRIFNDFLRLGKQRFPGNPFFHVCEAGALLKRRGHRRQVWNIKSLLLRGQQLTAALPPGHRHKTLQETIDAGLRTVEQMNPFAGMFGRFDPSQFFDGSPFDAFGGPDDDEGW